MPCCRTAGGAGSPGANRCPRCGWRSPLTPLTIACAGMSAALIWLPCSGPDQAMVKLSAYNRAHRAALTHHPRSLRRAGGFRLDRSAPFDRAQVHREIAKLAIEEVVAQRACNGAEGQPIPGDVFLAK